MFEMGSYNLCNHVLANNLHSLRRVHRPIHNLRISPDKEDFLLQSIASQILCITSISMSQNCLEPLTWLEMWCGLFPNPSYNIYFKQNWFCCSLYIYHSSSLPEIHSKLLLKTSNCLLVFFLSPGNNLGNDLFISFQENRNKKHTWCCPMVWSNYDCSTTFLFMVPIFGREQRSSW